MTTSANLGFPHVTTGQAGGEVTHNDALNMIDGLTHASVQGFDINAPPGSPANGQVWKIGAAPTGAWAGHADEIALYYTGWIFVAAKLGMIIFNEATGILLVCTNVGTDTWGTITVT